MTYIINFNSKNKSRVLTREEKAIESSTNEELIQFRSANWLHLGLANTPAQARADDNKHGLISLTRDVAQDTPTINGHKLGYKYLNGKHSQTSALLETELLSGRYMTWHTYDQNFKPITSPIQIAPEQRFTKNDIDNLKAFYEQNILGGDDNKCLQMSVDPTEIYNISFTDQSTADISRRKGKLIATSRRQVGFIRKGDINHTRVIIPGYIESTYQVADNGIQKQQTIFTNSLLFKLFIGDKDVKITDEDILTARKEEIKNIIHKLKDFIQSIDEDLAASPQLQALSINIGNLLGIIKDKKASFEDFVAKGRLLTLFERVAKLVDGYKDPDALANELNLADFYPEFKNELDALIYSTFQLSVNTVHSAFEQAIAHEISLSTSAEPQLVELSSNLIAAATSIKTQIDNLPQANYQETLSLNKILYQVTELINDPTDPNKIYNYLQKVEQVAATITLELKTALDEFALIIQTKRLYYLEDVLQHFIESVRPDLDIAANAHSAVIIEDVGDGAQAVSSEAIKDIVDEAQAPGSEVLRNVIEKVEVAEEAEAFDFHQIVSHVNELKTAVNEAQSEEPFLLTTELTKLLEATITLALNYRDIEPIENYIKDTKAALAKNEHLANYPQIESTITNIINGCTQAAFDVAIDNLVVAINTIDSEFKFKNELQQVIYRLLSHIKALKKANPQDSLYLTKLLVQITEVVKQPTDKDVIVNCKAKIDDLSQAHLAWKDLIDEMNHLKNIAQIIKFHDIVNKLTLLTRTNEVEPVVENRTRSSLEVFFTKVRTLLQSVRDEQGEKPELTVELTAFLEKTLEIAKTYQDPAKIIAYFNDARFFADIRQQFKDKINALDSPCVAASYHAAVANTFLSIQRPLPYVDDLLISPALEVKKEVIACAKKLKLPEGRNQLLNLTSLLNQIDALIKHPTDPERIKAYKTKVKEIDAIHLGWHELIKSLHKFEASLEIKKCHQTADSVQRSIKTLQNSLTNNIPLRRQRAAGSDNAPHNEIEALLDNAGQIRIESDEDSENGSPPPSPRRRDSNYQPLPRQDENHQPLPRQAPVKIPPTSFELFLTKANELVNAIRSAQPNGLRPASALTSLLNATFTLLEEDNYKKPDAIQKYIDKTRTFLKTYPQYKKHVIPLVDAAIKNVYDEANKKLNDAIANRNKDAHNDVYPPAARQRYKELAAIAGKVKSETETLHKKHPKDTLELTKILNQTSALVNDPTNSNKVKDYLKKADEVRCHRSGWKILGGVILALTGVAFLGVTTLGALAIFGPAAAPVVIAGATISTKIIGAGTALAGITGFGSLAASIGLFWKSRNKELSNHMHELGNIAGKIAKPEQEQKPEQEASNKQGNKGIGR